MQGQKLTCAHVCILGYGCFEFGILVSMLCNYLKYPPPINDISNYLMEGGKQKIKNNQPLNMV
jgi:hypothetical protein